MQEILKDMDSDEDLKNTFYRFGVISELMQRYPEIKIQKSYIFEIYYKN